MHNIFSKTNKLKSKINSSYQFGPFFSRNPSSQTPQLLYEKTSLRKSDISHPIVYKARTNKQKLLEGSILSLHRQIQTLRMIQGRFSGDRQPVRRCLGKGKLSSGCKNRSGSDFTGDGGSGPAGGGGRRGSVRACEGQGL